MASETIPYFQPPLGGPDAPTIANAERILAMHGEAKIERIKNTLLVCTSQVATGKGCGATQRIADTVYIQTHWYVPPHGCTGGAYWKHGEGQFRCNSCGHVNRLYDSPDIVAVKAHFKSVEDKED